MAMENSKILVIGGVNVDIGARPDKPLIQNDSNPGNITTSLGGVARNIAHNLCLLGEKPTLLCALGDDLYADEVLLKCEEAGIGMQEALRVSGEMTSTYLFIDDENGEMQLAVSDMHVCDHLTTEYFASKIGLIKTADLIVLDTNIPEESIRFILESADAPVVVDPVSVSKAAKLSSCLGKIHTLKPNRLEAEALSGIRITDVASCRRAANELLSKGVQRVFISLGSEGVLAAQQDMTLQIPCFEASVVNTTGAGDAFMAACCKATVMGCSLEETARMGAAAAAIAIESPFTIHDGLCMEMLKARMQAGE